MAQKVLLVDDVSMFLELEKNYLERAAVSLLTARDGKEALAICKAQRPALIFMDLHMPLMNGADCCRAIKEDRQLAATPVVLITSEGKDADRESCLAAGCDGFLTKPLDRSVFLETARRLLPTIDRRDPRVSCRIKGKYRAFGITLSGTITDISRTGIYLSTESEIQENTSLDVVFALPDPIGAIVQAKGRVAWVNTKKTPRKSTFPEGFGVEFVFIPEEAARELSRFLETEIAST